MDGGYVRFCKSSRDRQAARMFKDELGRVHHVERELTDRRPSEAPELPADVAGGGSVEQLVR